MNYKVQKYGLLILLLLNIFIYLLSKTGTSFIFFLKNSYFLLFLFDALAVIVFVRNIYLKYIFSVILLVVAGVNLLSFKADQIVTDKTFFIEGSQLIVSEYVVLGQKTSTYTIWDKKYLGFYKQTDEINVFTNNCDDGYCISITQSENPLVTYKQVDFPKDGREFFLKEIYPRMAKE